MANTSQEVVTKAAQRAAAEAAVRSIGLGYDFAVDLRLNCCKRSSDMDPRVIVLGPGVSSVDIPGGISIPGVPESIKCGKGENERFNSDLLSFTKMSELFNLELGVDGRVPSGPFNTAFELVGDWRRDATETKALAFDRITISLYNIELEKSAVVLRDHVKDAVPRSWDPSALARFIQLYGTHIVVGVTMGGEDVVRVCQQRSSNISPDDLQKRVKDMADNAFGKGKIRILEEEDIKFIHKRKGGSKDMSLSHERWCPTVQYDPAVISMKLVPISSLLKGNPGSGFLSNAINLYIRYKPPIEDLHQFLALQLPRQWAPNLSELPLGPMDITQGREYLRFGFMGPKLHINTNTVYTNKKPVTGLRLYLEGRNCDTLALHLQHLNSQPRWFRSEDVQSDYSDIISKPSTNSRYYEKVRWRFSSHVCTEAVEADDDLSIVTGAHLEVRWSGIKKVLFLCLHFTKVTNAAALRKVIWDVSPALKEVPGIVETLISTRFSMATKSPAKLAEVNLNSAVYPTGPPAPIRKPKMLKYVDTTEMIRGAQDFPGYWVVSGARLCVGNGKIALVVKYSLLDIL